MSLNGNVYLIQTQEGRIVRLGRRRPCFHSPFHYKLTYTYIKHQELPNQKSHTEIEDDICAFGHTSHSIVDGETELMNLHCTTTHDTTHTLLHEVRFLNA